MFDKAPPPPLQTLQSIQRKKARKLPLSLSSPTNITLNQYTYIIGVLNVHATVTGLRVRTGCCSSAV